MKKIRNPGNTVNNQIDVPRRRVTRLIAAVTVLGAGLGVNMREVFAADKQRATPPDASQSKSSPDLMKPGASQSKSTPKMMAPGANQSKSSPDLMRPGASQSKSTPKMMAPGATQSKSTPKLMTPGAAQQREKKSKSKTGDTK
ncbi:MAG: hypothetical protein ACU836_17920 [Gammaproteobacteria bacterium]